jgi:hypothetical protein
METLNKIPVNNLERFCNEGIALLLIHVHGIDQCRRNISVRRSRILKTLPEQTELGADVGVVDRAGKDDTVRMVCILQELGYIVLDPALEVVTVILQLAGKAAAAAGKYVIVQADDLHLSFGIGFFYALNKCV